MINSSKSYNVLFIGEKLDLCLLPSFTAAK